MAKHTPQVPQPSLAKLDGSWVLDSDENQESLHLPLGTSSTRSSTLVQATKLRQKETGEDYNIQRGRSRVSSGGDIEVDVVASDCGEDYDSPQISAPTSSQSLDLAYAASSRQLPHVPELADPSRRRSARRGIMACADSVVGKSGETGVKAPSESKTFKRKAIGLSQRFGIPSDAREEKKARADHGAPTDPDLVMPSIYEEGLESSWIDSETPTRRKATRSAISIPVESEGGDRAEYFRSRNLAPRLRVRPAAITDSFTDFLKSIVGWVFDITRGALGKLKAPLSYFLAIYIFIGLLIFFRNLLTSSIYSALSPICRLPGASLLSLPMCYSEASVQYQGDGPPAVQFDKLINVQSKFEAVLEESAGGVSLPLDMKRSETSIRDLRQVVRYSNLHSKNELVLEFDGFVETARIASFDLQKFNSHVGRGVDNILATARWTKRVLEDMALRDESKGAIVSFFHDRFFTPFQPLKFTHDTLLEHYIQHTRIVEQEIHRLIDEAQTLLRVLQNLEDRLDIIHGIAVRDDIYAQGSRAEVLSQLWTKVGGNRDKLGKFNSELRLLSQVNTYRQSAIAHVSGTMIKLQGMGAELEELRERVGGVELLGGGRGFPISVLIENIELGVERLEKSRNRAKVVENEKLMKMLERGKREANEIEGV